MFANQGAGFLSNKNFQYVRVWLIGNILTNNLLQLDKNVWNEQQIIWKNVKLCI